MWSKWIQIFQDSTGQLSSKRVFGGLGFICGLAMCFCGIPVDVIALIVGTSAAMLGLDTVMDIWKR